MARDRISNEERVQRGLARSVVDRRTKKLNGAHCLRWGGSTSGGDDGARRRYPLVKIFDGFKCRSMSGARAIFIIFNNGGSPLPEGHEVDHICHRPMCVELKHLRCVTKSENLKGRKLRRREQTKRVKAHVETTAEGLRRAKAGLPPRRIHSYPGAIPLGAS